MPRPPSPLPAARRAFRPRLDLLEDRTQPNNLFGLFGGDPVGIGDDAIPDGVFAPTGASSAGPGPDTGPAGTEAPTVGRVGTVDAGPAAPAPPPAPAGTPAAAGPAAPTASEPVFGPVVPGTPIPPPVPPATVGGPASSGPAQTVAPIVGGGRGQDPYTLYTQGDGYVPGVSGLSRAEFNASYVPAPPAGLPASGPGPVALPAASVPDPGASGARAVTTQEYNFGDSAFAPPALGGPGELIAQVKAPTDLGGTAHPLIVLLHGRHFTTYQDRNAFSEWPPAAGHQSIPSYQGYDYLGDALASNGYIVVSISANGINARDNDTPDYGALARAQLVQRHLDIWNALTTTGTVPAALTGSTDQTPFGTRFVGKVDMRAVGLMGQSRGGEGVVRAYQLNQSLGSPYGIAGVFALAPTDFSRLAINDVPLAVLLPYADGDVSDLEGVHFYDDARYNVASDAAPKETILVMGACHNFFNTVWTPGGWPAGALDDGQLSGLPAGQRITPAQEQGTGSAYVSAFFRTYVGRESAFEPILKGDVPPPDSAQLGPDAIHVSYQAGTSERRDVNRLTGAADRTTNTLGGAVTQSGLAVYSVYGGPGETRYTLPGEPSARFPHTVPATLARGAFGLSQLNLGYSNTTEATYENDLPAGTRDESAYTALSFRVGVNFTDLRNPSGMPSDFCVCLVDGDGNAYSAQVSHYSTALYGPPGPVTRSVPHELLNTVRLPLSAFAQTIDIRDVRQIWFAFHLQPSADYLMADLAFAK